MTTIHVPASVPYDVLIGDGLLDDAGARIAAVTGVCRAAILTDDIVDGFYGARVEQSLQRAGFDTVKFVFPNGEASKNLAVFGQALNFLAEHRLTRRDLVIALGGGVTGDLAGFAAACYLRGVRYVQIPTTLLAAVDSSVGGKTAVDLPAGKNLAGAFHQPCLVLCDPLTLGTLPQRVFIEGMAEVIKYGVLEGEPLFTQLERKTLSDEAMIAACVASKRDVVSADEFDRGARQLLNLGHTIGHAVEKASGFTLYHGECVAIGLAAIARAAAALGFATESDRDRILTLLGSWNLPTRCDNSAETLFALCGSDKKVQGSTITLAVPEAIGRCTLRTVPLPELRTWIEKGLTV